MIRSKSCLRKKKEEKKNEEDENSEEKEKKSFNSEEDCDIDNILYGKEKEREREKRKPFMNIIEDDDDGKKSVIKCIDFNDVFLTSSNMFTENIEKNNLYNKYIQKFDDIYDKMIAKFKENLKNNNNENIKETNDVSAKEKEKEKEDNNYNDIQSELTKSE